MPLFGRKKAAKVTMSYAPGGPKVALVSTPGGPKPLQEIVDWGWFSIAAMGWWGCHHYGRGVVLFDAEQGGLAYGPVAGMDDCSPERRSVLDACATYDPATQVVLVTTIVHARGIRRAPEDFIVTLTTPEGGESPRAACAQVSPLDTEQWHDSVVTPKQDYSQRQQKGLDPVSV